MLRLSLISSIILSATLLAACSDESTTGPDGSVSGTPGVGTTYTMHRFNADTTGAPIAGSGDTAVTTLAATNAQHAGESSVHVFTQDLDTVARLRHEANGDVLYYPSWQGARLVGWITLPIATKGSTERTLRDTVLSLPDGQSGRNRVTLTVAYVSSEQVSVGEKTIEAHEVRIRIVDVNPLTVDQNLTITSTHTVWYAPSIGYFTRSETGESQESPFSTITGPIAVSALTSYELK